MAFGGSDILKLIVDADTKGAVSEFKKLETSAGSSLDGVEKKATGLKGKMSSAFGSLSGVMASLGPAAIAGGVAAGIGVAVNAASDLNEQISKTKSVFGQSSTEILKWSESSATALGQSKTQALEAASSFGNLFMQLGLTGSAVTDMSTKMVGLASDFGSFFNTDPATALEAISAAFRGEFDSVQKFVPTINAAAVQQEVLREGLANTTSEITEQDKAVATYNLLLSGAGKATGDFARTSDSLANQQRILKAQVSDAAAEIGNKLLPSLATLAGIASKAIQITVDIKSNTGIDLLEGGAKGWTLLAGAIKDTYVPAVEAAVQAGAKIPGTLEAGTVATGGFARSGAEMGASLDRAANSFGTFEQRAAGIGHAMAEQAEATKKANDALATHTNLVLEAAGGMLGVGAAQREFNKAIEDNIKVQTDSKATTDDKAAALDRETSAALSVAQATVEYAKKQEEAQGKTLDAKAANDILISTLYTLSGKTSPEVQAALAGIITKLQETGAQKPTPTVTVNGVEQSKGQLADVQRAADSLDRTSATITVGANVSAAKNAVNGLIRGLNSISSLTGKSFPTIAKGSKNFPGGIALVGERGPELAFIPKGTQVKTAAETKAIMDGPTLSALPARSGSSGSPVYITVQGAVDPYSTARQIQTILAKGGYAGFSAKAA